MLLINLFICVEVRAQEGLRCASLSLSSGEGSAKRNISSGMSDDTYHGIIRIPVVVHIVEHQSSAHPITDEQVISQLEVLNEDFRRQNADTVLTLPVFRHLAADCEIEFVLVNRDPSGQPSNGITRTTTLHGAFANSDIHYLDRGGKDAWDSNRYLNIWVCDLAEGISGWGTAPGAPVAADGVVIDYQFFGTTGTAEPPFNLGRTATHEVGHWLGLQHLWGINGGCSGSDEVEDTPSQEGPSQGCDTGKQSCGSPDMVQNYMDLSDDACMNLFTTGQKKVMRTTLQTYRRSILDASATLLHTTTGLKQPGWLIYPNPIADDWLTIQHPAIDYTTQWVLYDYTGKEVQCFAAIEKGILKLHMAQLTSAIYRIQIIAKDQKVSVSIVRQ